MNILKGTIKENFNKPVTNSKVLSKKDIYDLYAKEW